MYICSVTSIVNRIVLYKSILKLIGKVFLILKNKKKEGWKGEFLRDQVYL